MRLAKEKVTKVIVNYLFKCNKKTNLYLYICILGGSEGAAGGDDDEEESKDVVDDDDDDEEGDEESRE